MTVNELAGQLEREYWRNNRHRLAVGNPPGEDETVAANAYLPTLAKHTARAGVRFAKRHRGNRLDQTPAVSVVQSVVHEAEAKMRRDPECGIVLETIAALVIRSLLENLAWRLALWLLSESAHDERADLLCRMQADND
jgi:hypothetical protein